MKSLEFRAGGASAAAGAAAAILWLLAAAAGIVWGTAADGRLLTREMLKYAPPETTGLPEAEYAGVAEMTAEYLTGRTDRFEYVFLDADGNEYLCFQEHEAAHMADCRELIRLAGKVCLTAAAVLGAGVAGIISGVIQQRQRKRLTFDPSGRRNNGNGYPGALPENATKVMNPPRSGIFARGILIGLCAASVIATALTAWAWADFDGFFTAFHRAAFTNDGWLLDPRTDLLIRLMPTEFFISLGLRGLRLFAAVAAAAGAAAAGAVRRTGSARKRRERRPA